MAAVFAPQESQHDGANDGEGHDHHQSDGQSDVEGHIRLSGRCVT